MDSANKRTFNLITLPIIDSTNSYLKGIAAESKPWDSVRAIEQTGGRGRFQRRWIAEPGRDLTFSTLIPVSEDLMNCLPNITQVVAVAVSQALLSLEIEQTIKWPNDILVSGKKICGILVEGIFTGSKQYLIAGIGLNVNSAAGNFDGVESTSIKALLDREVDIEELLIQIVTRLQSLLQKVSEEGISFIIAYCNRYLAFRGELKRIVCGETSFEGVIKGVSSDGALIIMAEGKEEHLISGEISFR